MELARALVCHQLLEQLGHHDGGPAEFRSLNRLLYTMGTLISQLQAQRDDEIGAIIWRSVTRGVQEDHLNQEEEKPKICLGHEKGCDNEESEA